MINVIAIYLTDLDIYFSSITQLISIQNDGAYDIFFRAKNQAIKSSIILCAQLHIKQGTENVDKIIECIESIEEKVKEIGTNTNVIWRENFRNRENINGLNTEKSAVIDKMNDFLDLFPELIRLELEK